MTTENERSSSSLGILNILIFLLSIYVLVALLVSTLVKLDPEVKKILEYIDILICIIFLFDFFYRFFKASDKLAFMKWGWIDLLSSIPTVDFLRAGRVFRLIRIFRIIRAFKSINQIVAHVYANRAKGVFSTVVITTFMVYLFSSIAILQVETDPHSNIRSAEDALWWAYATLTTVGYGDKYPVTTEGRIIAAILMTTGVGLGGTFAGYVASFLLGKDPKEEK